jgi:multiple sugar transport system ATP-binding protein
LADLLFNHLKKRYDNNPYTVKDFHLKVPDKEFLVLVGPSGCGKSTTLRMIAGLEEITEGELYIGGQLVNAVSPKDRDIAMVFQSYALYPHMSVYDNMSFALKIRKMAKVEIDQRIKEVARILDIEHLLDRKPEALSGGQRQRVALGRAIVRNPKVFLMDEPLSNLDAKLRVQMRTEITTLQRRLETTTVYVTHDQTEAMTMGDRIVVMYDGVVQQVDTPKNIYDYPVNKFVAGFIGSPAMNFLEGRIVNDGSKIYFANSVLKLGIPEGVAKGLCEQGYIGKEVICGIRPEIFHDEQVTTFAFQEAKFSVMIDLMENMGFESYLYFKIERAQVMARVPNRNQYWRGDRIDLVVDMDKCHFFDKYTEKAIR